MIFFKLILTNLRRHRIRSFISIAGVAFSVAAMLTVVTILQGAIGMFSSILSSDSQMIVFGAFCNVSDPVFQQCLPTSAADEIASVIRWCGLISILQRFFGIVSSAVTHPIITCFGGVTPDDARIRKAVIGISGNRATFASHDDDVVLGTRAADFLGAALGSHVPSVTESFM